MCMTQLISILTGFHIDYAVLVEKAKSFYDDTCYNHLKFDQS